MKIALDAMSGDFAPVSTVKGAVEALNEIENLEIILVGKESIIEEELKKYCDIKDEDKRFLISALENLKISARVYDKILKIARTIADLEGKEELERKHLLEAISFKK